MSLVENRKARFNYEILEKFEAGISLLGCEVKAVREGQISLDGSHISLKKIPPYLVLVGVNITPIQPLNLPKDYNPVRQRELLVKKSELAQFEKALKQKGTTLIPLSIYKKRGLIKVEVAVVRGKKKFDKREDEKKKDAKREIDRVMKSR